MRTLMQATPPLGAGLAALTLRHGVWPRCGYAAHLLWQALTPTP
jgi:hypothetical protein